MDRWLGRVRLFVGNNAAVVLAVLAVLALAGGIVTYNTHVDPGTETEQVETASWSATADVTHEATVVAGTDVFSEGEVLTDRSTYLTSITPELDGTLRYEYEATGGGDLTVEINQTLVLRSVGEETEFWREESQLGTASEQSVGSGEEVPVSFAVNVTALSERVDEIEDQLGGTPGQSEIIVGSTVTVSGERNGQAVGETMNHELEIEDGGQIYSVAGAPETDSGQQFEERTVTASYGPLRSIGGPLLLFLGLVGTLGVAGASTMGRLDVSETERNWTSYRSERREFDEWITEGSIPGTAMERETVQIDSLEGLVDVAIDSNRRVISDEGSGSYAVLLEETVYIFEPPAEPQNGTEPLAEGESATVPESDNTAASDEQMADGGDDERADAGEDDGEGANGEDKEQADSMRHD